MAECNGCGMCCWPILFPHSKEEVAAKPALTSNAVRNQQFILKFWHEVEDDDQVQRMNPLVHAKELREDGGHFYRCDYYDPQTRKCTAHNQRPPICRGYPWYKEDLPPTAETASRLLPYPFCSYWEDVPVEIRPKDWPKPLRSTPPTPAF